VLGVQCAKALGLIDVTFHSKISLVVRVEMVSHGVSDIPSTVVATGLTCVCVELMRSGVEPSVDSYQTSTCMHTRVSVSVRITIGRRSWCHSPRELRSKSASDLRSAHLKGYDEQERSHARFAARGRPLDRLLAPHRIVAPAPRRADSLGGRKRLMPGVAAFRARERPVPRRRRWSVSVRWSLLHTE